jgi:hypothetical protein
MTKHEISSLYSFLCTITVYCIQFLIINIWLLQIILLLNCNTSTFLEHTAKYFNSITGGVQIPKMISSSDPKPSPQMHTNTHLDLRDGESYSGDDSRFSLLFSLLQPQAGRPTAQSDKTDRNQHMLTNVSCFLKH